MKLRLGIDEAGRGCVLGPLVVACVATDEPGRRWFAQNNVRDSKIVSPLEREKLAEKIFERCWVRVQIAHPVQIDMAVRDRSRTLNGLERELMAALLQEFEVTHPAHEASALVDACSINAIAFTQQLLHASKWKNPKTLRAIHHADARDRTVAAASIIAKVTRDRLLSEIQKEIDVDFGCGYPHDPLTRAFLQRCAPDSPHVRWTWRTAQTKTPTLP